MAFGQSSGPPATARQVAELLALVQAAGHADFRDARGPLGLNQRQAAGKFTRDEADAFIALLQPGDPADAAPLGTPVEAAAPSRSRRAAPAPAPVRPAAPAGSATEQALRRVSSELLAAELQRRGWVVLEP